MTQNTQTLPHKSETDIMDFVQNVVKRDIKGVVMFPTDYIQAMLDIIARQQKEIKHCQKHLNRAKAWKNKFWLSVQKTEDSGYHRKYGLQGKRAFGYSVRLRVLGKEVI